MPVTLAYKGAKAVFENREIPFRDSLEQDELKIQLSFGETIKGTVWAEKEIFLERIELEFEIQGDFVFFKNGFQSWSPSGEIRGEPPRPRVLIKALTLHWDDPGYLNEVPYFQKSHFLTYLRSGQQILFLEARDLPIPLVHFMVERGTLKVISEIRRLTPNVFAFLDLKVEELPGLLLNQEKPERVFGWTSWYYYYERVKPEDVLLNLKLSSRFPFPLTYFQIDDGWEESIGDWQENRKFKGWLGIIVERIRERGINPGIWLAPFAVEKKSRIFNNKDWLLKDERGKPVVAGFNPAWRGHFYALDPTHPEVEEYLSERVFFLREIGFELFKFDYLYTLALDGKRYAGSISRREAIERGMKILKKAVEGGKILACGAPLLLSPFCNFLRIGPDTSGKWEDKLVKIAGHLGGVEARNCIQNTLARFFLDGKFWLSDPDVLILRKCALDEIQQRTLIFTNFFLSRFHFYSDPLNIVPPENLGLLEELKRFQAFRLLEGTPGEVFQFRGETAKEEVVGFMNLTEAKRDLKVEEGFAEFLKPREDLTLLPHETRVFTRRKAGEGN